MLDMLHPDGILHPLLERVRNDGDLRMDIRDHRFNIYYRGGSLLCVDGRKSPPALRFDAQYFKGHETPLPTLPPQLVDADDIKTWIDALPALRKGMDAWWALQFRRPGPHDNERAHCQLIASANSPRTTQPSTDYLVLDLEYQWAQRRFDMVAAKRRPTTTDPVGWVAPNLVFVEVKSESGSCRGKSGIEDHTRDYGQIIAARNGESVRAIKAEYCGVIRQKQALGLLPASLPFQGFADAVPELLLVLVNLDPKLALPEVPLQTAGVCRCMVLHEPDYALTDDKIITW
jgi:hypothetical protein